MGVGKGSAYLAKSRLPGAHFRSASGERAGKSPPEYRWLRLVRDMTLRFCGLADMAEWWCCGSVPHRREWRCSLVSLREQGVRVEADHLFAQPVVNMLHRFHDRCQLINSKDFCCLLDVAE